MFHFDNGTRKQPFRGSFTLVAKPGRLKSPGDDPGGRDIAAREPRQIDQPRPLGYVALPVFHFYLWQDVFFVVMASLSGLFDFNLTNGQLLDYNHVPIDV